MLTYFPEKNKIKPSNLKHWVDCMDWNLWVYHNIGGGTGQ